MPENLPPTESIKKLEKKSQDRDSPDLLEKKDFKNQANQNNPKNHGSDNLNNI